MERSTLNWILRLGQVASIAALPFIVGARGCGEGDVDTNCTAVWQPVCGTDGRTFPNDCEATLAGVEVAHEGSCQIACPEYYGPVCGDDGVTYDNECFANASGARIAHPGRCDGEGCAFIYSPVCGVDRQTYANACTADRAGVDIAYEGECASDCVCPEIFAPVCGADGQTYSNACHAACRQVDVAHEGECRNDCPAYYAPVCGGDGQTYGNACEALSRGVRVAHEGACACAPAACLLYCEFGNAIDPLTGCPTCACNDGPSSCESDSDCPSGESCERPVIGISPNDGDAGTPRPEILGVCVPRPEARCTTDLECGSDAYCELSCVAPAPFDGDERDQPIAPCTGICRSRDIEPPVACGENGECPTGTACVAPACAAYCAPGADGNPDDDCVSDCGHGYCVEVLPTEPVPSEPEPGQPREPVPSPA